MDLMKYKNDFKSDMRALLDAHGSWTAVPADDVHFLSERLRAAYVLDVAERDGLKDVPLILRQYGVDRRVIEEICGFVPEPEPKEKRADRMAEFFTAVTERAGEVLSTSELAELGGFSEATARKATTDRPDLFTKVGRGRYVLRNPEEDRAAEAADMEGRTK